LNVADGIAEEVDTAVAHRFAIVVAGPVVTSAHASYLLGAPSV